MRFAPVGAAIKVKNLSQWVTNELLEYAFSVFGDVRIIYNVASCIFEDVMTHFIV